MCSHSFLTTYHPLVSVTPCLRAAARRLRSPLGWPGIFVVPANLTVHIISLRRTLGDRLDGNRFIVNVPGRGYCFTASVKAECVKSADLLNQRPDEVRIPDQLVNCDEVTSCAARAPESPQTCYSQFVMQ